MRIALAQINPVIGDFVHNSGLIKQYAEQARERGCELVVFPELALCGYPPLDLLERPSFLAMHDAAFSDLVKSIAGIGVLCGIVERHTDGAGKPLHNSAALFADGEIIAMARKRLLPVYDVFDESRYFTPGSRSESVYFKGLGFGITICEDVWNDEGLFGRKLYNIDPVADLVEDDKTELDLLINISASPFHIGKNRTRHEIFSKLCQKYDLPLLHVNQVGGQDSLLFDGHSLAMDYTGRVRALAHGFREDMVVIDTESWQGEMHGDDVVLQQDDPGSVLDALVMGLRDYAGKCGFKKALLGLSGGIDSSLTAVIACQALGAENVLGVSMPSPFTAAESVSDSRQLAENLGCGFEVISVAAIYQLYLDTLEPFFSGRQADVTEQNIQARIRGNLLMAMSNKHGHLLLSTGNKSELAVGYCTLYGDMSGGLAVIADLPKLLVYELARQVNAAKEVIPVSVLARPPSAELAPDQRDDDDLPPYEVLDPILAAYLEGNLGVNEIVGMGFERPVVEDVVQRIRRNEYKRQQAPPCLKVTSKAFGRGRRYPLAQNFREEKF